MTRHVLITGGFGFLGRHLVGCLLRDGEDVHVHVVDDMSSTALDVTAFTRSWGAALSYDIDTVVHWASQGPALWQFDEIYHLASPVGPVGVLQHAGQIVRRVVEDAYCVLEIALRDRAVLCNVSTSEIYGGGREGACAEHDARVFPAEVTVRLEYAAAKLAAETALINMSRSSDLAVVIVRPFNVAGPGQLAAGGFVVPRFVGQALAREPLTVYGDGRAVRAFTHVVDVAEGLVLAVRCHRKAQGSDQSYAVYNLGNARNRTPILGLAHLVLQVTGSDSSIMHVDPCVLHGALFAEAGNKFPDGDLAERELGWCPSRDLERIVRDAVDYAKMR